MNNRAQNHLASIAAVTDVSEAPDKGVTASVRLACDRWFQQRGIPSSDIAAERLGTHRPPSTQPEKIIVLPIAPINGPITNGHWQPTDAQEKQILEVIQPVLAEFGLDLCTIRGKRRSRFIARARHACMIAARTQTAASLHELGRFFNRDHTVILYALSKRDSTTASN